jgi:3-methyladenine DNA glycosylase Tag
MNTPKVSDPGKEYFLKVVSRKWNFREAFTHYEHTLKLPSNTVCQIMESDLNLITKSRKAFAEPSNAIFFDLQVRWHTYQQHNYIDSFVLFPFIVLIVLRKTDRKPAIFSDTTTHRYRPY